MIAMKRSVQTDAVITHSWENTVQHGGWNPNDSISKAVMQLHFLKEGEPLPYWRRKDPIEEVRDESYARKLGITKAYANKKEFQQQLRTPLIVGLEKESRACYEAITQDILRYDTIFQNILVCQ